MTNNRKSFDKAMKKAANHSLNQSWSKAIKEYSRALKEFPNDTAALVGLGVAHMESGQLDSARDVFSKLKSSAPGDPAALKQLAVLEEKMGHPEQAGALWTDLAIALEKQGDLVSAADAWSSATRAVPTNVRGYQKAGRIYAELGDTEHAVDAYLGAARELQSSGQASEMVRTLRVVLQLAPDNGEAAQLLEVAHGVPDVGLDGESDSAGPLETARRAAWSELAQMLFEDLSLEMMSDTDVVPLEERRGHHGANADTAAERSRVITLIGRAVDLDSKGHVEGAIQAYQDVIRSGVDRVAVHFNLGLLYKFQGQLEEACRHLSITKFHPVYALASHLALGECYQEHDRLDLAMQNYVQALKVADLQIANEMRVPDIAAIYDSMLDSYGREGRYGHGPTVLAFFNTVRVFFHSEEWLERAVRLRTYLDELSSTGVAMSLADGLKTRDFGGTFEALAEIRFLVNRGFLLTATEECYRALEKEPQYLPFHFRLADIFIRQGMINDAVSKYMIIAGLYEVSDNLVQSSNVYRAMLALTPLDVKVRSKLIDLLINRREIDQALEQHLALADAYYQLARVDKALETFNEALRLSERSDSGIEYRLKILYFMADLYSQRVEWNKAAEIYEQIRDAVPEDYQSSLHLMDLYFKQGKPEHGMRELQALLQPYEERNDSVLILEILREAVRLRPNELPIRARLSRAYIESGMKQEAIAELDAIGEMQLEADMRDEAIQTIRLIISLKPANVKAYKQLLYHLLS